MTAQKVFDLTMALIDEIEDDGTIVDVELYSAKAPALITLLQRQIAKAEGVYLTRPITALTDELEISDENAENVLTYGLAAKYALSDLNSDFYQEYYTEYKLGLRGIRRDEEEIHDEYNITDGMRY